MSRRPKPAATRRATGNPGKRPIPDVQLPETGVVKKPLFLAKHERAAELWEEYAPALTILGTLRAESAHLFATWCCETAMYERSPKRFNASRITQIRTLASSLGMDPSAQSKLPTAKHGDKDPAEAFFSGPRAVG